MINEVISDIISILRRKVNWVEDWYQAGRVKEGSVMRRGGEVPCLRVWGDRVNIPQYVGGVYTSEYRMSVGVVYLYDGLTQTERELNSKLDEVAGVFKDSANWDDGWYYCRVGNERKVMRVDRFIAGIVEIVVRRIE
jgi:hypothetical protein